MNKSLRFFTAFLLLSAVGLQALPVQNIDLDPIRVATTKKELIDILQVIDRDLSGNKIDWSSIGTVIGTIGGPAYSIAGVGYQKGDGHINQLLKKIELPVDSCMNFKKGDKISAGKKHNWYVVKQVYFDCANNYLGLVLVENTYLE
jgi:hypothetical protein